jgi:hypothetical protein
MRPLGLPFLWRIDSPVLFLEHTLSPPHRRWRFTTLAATTRAPNRIVFATLATERFTHRLFRSERLMWLSCSGKVERESVADEATSILRWGLRRVV